MQLDEHLIAQIYGKANTENIVFWKKYRITVLGNRLFRLERSEKGAFRDEATQSVWFRNIPPQEFTCTDNGESLEIDTGACVLVLKEKRVDCRIVLNGAEKKLNNTGNLKGTYRTLDFCDGNLFLGNLCLPVVETSATKISLGNGVCSKSGVAVLDDSNSLRFGENGQLITGKYEGTDEYIFAFGNDYRGAVRALYQITGQTPLVPRFALGNWWSRFHAYTQEEYMQVLQRFEDYEVPLSVATIDMDWHYSFSLDEQKQITAQGKNTEYYGGTSGWTGYSWNGELFPDYKKFLQEIKERNLKITLNVHPALGVRWFEEQYEEMAEAMGVDPKTEERIFFDILNPKFVNAYFSILHKPYEKDGVDFWWLDWQQGTDFWWIPSQQGTEKVEGVDPLWLLNHYHYYDQKKESSSPLILSRYAGAGSHRYPLGFSGDTVCSWKTLA
ncbi:MAG: hypothetical protein IJF64_02420, partial [Clostridia bacterium]|nr:hypothetical protein [Clostridia bacterium]